MPAGGRGKAGEGRKTRLLKTDLLPRSICNQENTWCNEPLSVCPSDDACDCTNCMTAHSQMGGCAHCPFVQFTAAFPEKVYFFFYIHVPLLVLSSVHVMSVAQLITL